MMWRSPNVPLITPAPTTIHCDMPTDHASWIGADDYVGAPVGHVLLLVYAPRTRIFCGKIFGPAGRAPPTGCAIQIRIFCENSFEPDVRAPRFGCVSPICVKTASSAHRRLPAFFHFSAKFCTSPSMRIFPLGNPQCLCNFLQLCSTGIR